MPCLRQHPPLRRFRLKRPPVLKIHPAKGVCGCALAAAFGTTGISVVAMAAARVTLSLGEARLPSSGSTVQSVPLPAKQEQRSEQQQQQQQQQQQSLGSPLTQ